VRPSPTPATMSQPKQATPRASTPATSVPPASVSRPAQTNKSTTATSHTNKSTTASSHSPLQQEIYRNQALWHAAHPGPETNAHYTMYPDRVEFLGRARDQLVREAIQLADAGDEFNTRVYLETHKERKWMVDAAVKAKEQIEEGHSEEQLAGYMEMYPRQRAFLQYARKIWKPKPKPAPKSKPMAMSTRIVGAKVRSGWQKSSPRPRQLSS
jgi:hypothetical protein